MTPPINEELALLCPACGFDLRATTSPRCNECGLEIDRAALTISSIPWAHRQKMGRFRAYFKTLWQFTLDRRTLRYEAAKPQQIADGRSFRRVNAWLVATAFLVALAVIAYEQQGLIFLAVHRPNPYGTLGPSSTPTGLDYRLFDIAVPWSAGATLSPVLPVCLILTAFWLTGAQRFIFRATSSPAQQQRALALSHYASAPLVLLLPATLLLATARLFEKQFNIEVVEPPNLIVVTLTLIGGALIFIALIDTFLRSAQWVMRTRHCPLGAALLAISELLGLWVLGAIVLLGLFPWCIGFLWIVIDSLR